MNNIKVSDIITEEEISKWRSRCVVTINSNCGSGKSWWCLNTLYNYCEKTNKTILMLLPRVTCRDQFIYDLEVDYKKIDEVITVVTYQHMEKLHINGMGDFNYNSYDYIVCDEVFYYVSDSQFNSYTELTFKPIITSKAVKVLMSATIDFMVKYLKENLHITPVEYNIPFVFDNFKEVCFYNDDETLDSILQLYNITGDKTLVFMNSLEDQINYYERFGGMFYCSLTNKKGKKYIDLEKVGLLKEEERFNDNFLFTNKVLDMGTNIKDRDLKALIINGFRNISDIIQFLGRKRKLDDDDKYGCIYIRTYSKKQIEGTKREIVGYINEVDFLKQYGSKMYVDKFPNREKYKNPCIYDSRDENGDIIKMVNEFSYYYYILEIERMDEIKENKYGFIGYIVDHLGLKKGQYYKWNMEMSELEMYLKINIGNVMLTKDDREELIEKINLRDGHNRLCKNINTLNGYLEEVKLPYKIVELRPITKTIDGKRKKYNKPWELISLDKN